MVPSKTFCSQGYPGLHKPCPTINPASNQSAAPSAPCPSRESEPAECKPLPRGSAGRRGSTAADKENLNCPLPKGRGGGGGVGEQWKIGHCCPWSATSTWKRRGWRGRWQSTAMFCRIPVPRAGAQPPLGYPARSAASQAWERGRGTVHDVAGAFSPSAHTFLRALPSHKG